ncbi:MAG: MerC domain-containing protein [Bdellovibrionales bacterium]|nr:MerC domain-containing protein [Bdellovibrionales bacterium]
MLKSSELFKSTLLKSTKSDYLAIILSVLCMIHCIGLPILIAFAPSLSLAHGEYTHFIFFIFVTAFAIYSFARGYSIHKTLYPVKLAILGLVLIFLAIFAPHIHFLNIFTLENLLTTIGGIV